ncbi:MAG: serine/threonine protein kinase, partial [Deltaproteobacteria bacterium]|nr:serine/threonine protein kinase [Deltaproteobacteria bacterium]
MRVRPRATSSPKTTVPTEQFGPYIVFESMGEGGMASVHRAERVGPDGVRKSVALKRLWPHLSDDHDFVESFVQEAALASSLRHDHIAQAYECGLFDDTYYIAMELVPGPTLNDLMIQSRTAAGPVPLPIIVELLIQLCDALEHAHGANIIHRDVSPANIIVSTAGAIKLIDFGIAKAAHSRIQTQVGTIKGKLSYVAPEYTLGQLDHRADLFAVGVIAHELLTGRRLFHAATDIETVHSVRQKPIVPPSRSNPDVPHDLDDIVMTALQRDPEKRWQNAAAMRVALVNAARQIGPTTGRQIHHWIEWAFTREPWRESIVERLVQKLETGDAPDLRELRSTPVPHNSHKSGASPVPPVPSPPRRQAMPTLRLE